MPYPRSEDRYGYPPGYGYGFGPFGSFRSRLSSRPASKALQRRIPLDSRVGSGEFMRQHRAYVRGGRRPYHLQPIRGLTPYANSSLSSLSDGMDDLGMHRRGLYPSVYPGRWTVGSLLRGRSGRSLFRRDAETCHCQQYDAERSGQHRAWLAPRSSFPHMPKLRNPFAMRRRGLYSRQRHASYSDSSLATSLDFSLCPPTPTSLLSDDSDYYDSNRMGDGVNRGMPSFWKRHGFSFRSPIGIGRRGMYHA